MDAWQKGLHPVLATEPGPGLAWAGSVGTERGETVESQEPRHGFFRVTGDGHRFTLPLLLLTAITTKIINRQVILFRLCCECNVQNM